MNIHVFVSGQLVIERGVLEDDAEPLADLVLMREQVEAVDRPPFPLVGLSSVVRILIVVVLPAPLGPRKAKISPSSTAKEISATAVNLPEGLDQIFDANHRCQECSP